jgi:hypothetical protein
MNGAVMRENVVTIESTSGENISEEAVREELSCILWRAQCLFNRSALAVFFAAREWQRLQLLAARVLLEAFTEHYRSTLVCDRRSFYAAEADKRKKWLH